MCFTEIKLHHTNLLPPANEVAGRSGADPGFGQGGGGSFRVANVAERSRMSKVSYLQPGSRAAYEPRKLLGF